MAQREIDHFGNEIVGFKDVQGLGEKVVRWFEPPDDPEFALLQPLPSSGLGGAALALSVESNLADSHNFKLAA